MKSSVTLTFFLAGSASVHAMGTAKSLNTEHQTSSTAHAPSLRERLHRVVGEFQKMGWSLPSNIFLKHPREAEGQDVGLCATNGRDTIYAGTGHEYWYSSEEIDFMLAHELGHIAVKRHPWLNPHRYMDIYLHSATVFITANLMNLAFWKARRALPKSVIGLLSVGYGVSVLTNYDAYTITLDENKNVLDRSYDSLLKLEELECDLIAALVLPDGGKHGASYMQKTLNIFPRAENSKHPRTETRVAWLKAIAWLQEHTVQRHI